MKRKKSLLELYFEDEKNFNEYTVQFVPFKSVLYE